MGTSGKTDPLRFVCGPPPRSTKKKRRQPQAGAFYFCVSVPFGFPVSAGRQRLVGEGITRRKGAK